MSCFAWSYLNFRKGPCKAIISIIVICSILLAFLPIDITCAEPTPVAPDDKQKPAATSPQHLTRAQQNAEAMIDQKNSVLEPTVNTNRDKVFYDDQNRIIRIVSADDAKTTLEFTYDQNGAITRIVKTYGGTAPAGSPEQTIFDFTTMKATEKYADGIERIYSFEVKSGTPADPAQRQQGQVSLASWVTDYATGAYQEVVGYMVDVRINGQSLVDEVHQKLIDRGLLLAGDPFRTGTILYDPEKNEYTVPILDTIPSFGGLLTSLSYTAKVTDHGVEDSLIGYYSNGTVGHVLRFLSGSYREVYEARYYENGSLQYEITLEYDGDGIRTRFIGISYNQNGTISNVYSHLPENPSYTSTDYYYDENGRVVRQITADIWANRQIVVDYVYVEGQLRDVLIDGVSMADNLYYKIDQNGWWWYGSGLDFRTGSITYDFQTNSFIMSILTSIPGYGPYFESFFSVTIAGSDLREAMYSNYENGVLGRFTEFLSGPDMLGRITHDVRYYESGLKKSEEVYEYDQQNIRRKIIQTYYNANGNIIDEYLYDDWESAFSLASHYNYDSSGKLGLKITLDSRCGEIRYVYIYNSSGDLIETEEYFLPEGAGYFQNNIQRLINNELSREEKSQFIDSLIANLPAFTDTEMQSLFAIWVPRSIQEDQDLLGILVTGIANSVISHWDSNSFINWAPIQFIAGIAKAIGNKGLLDFFVIGFPKRGPDETSEHFEERKARLLALWENYGVIILDGNLGSYSHNLVDTMNQVFSVYPENLAWSFNVLMLTSVTDMRTAQYEGTMIMRFQDNYRPNVIDYFMGLKGNFSDHVLWVFLHEMGHMIHMSGAAPNVDTEFWTLWSISGDDPDNFAYYPYMWSSYLYENYREDFAETVRAYMRDSQGLLDYARALAALGNDILLRKVIFVANFFKKDGDVVYGFRIEYADGIPGDYTDAYVVRYEITLEPVAAGLTEINIPTKVSLYNYLPSRKAISKQRQTLLDAFNEDDILSD